MKAFITVHNAIEVLSYHVTPMFTIHYETTRSIVVWSHGHLCRFVVRIYFTFGILIMKKQHRNDVSETVKYKNIPRRFPN